MINIILLLRYLHIFGKEDDKYDIITEIKDDKYYIITEKDDDKWYIIIWKGYDILHR